VRFGAVLVEKESLKKTLISIVQSAERLSCGKVGEVGCLTWRRLSKGLNTITGDVSKTMRYVHIGKRKIVADSLYGTLWLC
jgi:hypothetical protein